MGRLWVVVLLILVTSSAGFSTSSASPPAKIISGVISNVASALIKWLWSLQSSPKTAISTRSMMKFEGGYTVETVFDGSKLGIDPYAVEVSQSGELLVLDSENSNIYKVSTPLSRYSRPKLIAGSSDGYTGHVDGKLREARMNHPKGITMDDRGNIYVADTSNMAIRKINEAGVVTIAGGTWSRGGGHIDGPSEDAKFSDDFDVVYVKGSCSLLVIDRGNQAIREIQLREDDCSFEEDGDLQLGIAVLVAAGFFGYMLALLQRRVRALFSTRSVPEPSVRKEMPPAPYQKPHKSVRPPLIPPEDEYEEQEDGLFSSMGTLFLNTGSTVVETFTSLFRSRKRPPQSHHMHHQYHHQPNRSSSHWPAQETFMIRDEDQPPPLETRTPVSRQNYPFVTKEMKQNRSSRGGWDGNYPHHHLQQQQQQQQQLQQQQQYMQQHHQRHYSSGPETYYEQSCESNEIVFGAVQEQDGRREAVVIKAMDYGEPVYNNNYNLRSRYNYMGYSSSYGY